MATMCMHFQQTLPEELDSVWRMTLRSTSHEHQAPEVHTLTQSLLLLSPKCTRPVKTHTQYHLSLISIQISHTVMILGHMANQQGTTTHIEVRYPTRSTMPSLTTMAQNLSQ
jgi:hypothetical protein